ncbi:MAG: hypothetical protein ABSH09_27845 [Bryobacteraceae bacterium]
MKARLRIPVILGFVLLTGCVARLPRSLRTEIRSENEKIQSADRELQRSEKTLRNDLAAAPDLFQGTSVAGDWQARLRSAREKLDDAKSQDREMERLARDDRADSQHRLEWLLAGERKERESAVTDADAVVASAEKWLSFRRNLSSSIDGMKREEDSIKAVDLTPAVKAVEKAEVDWPAKKEALESRLALLRAMPETANAKWQATEAARKDATAGKASATEIATLIQADDVLSQTARDLPQKVDDLRSQAGQLYNAWDKVLTDLDVSHEGPETVYREKIKTVQTHFTDVADKKTEISSNENWTDVPEPSYQAVENDLGMAIAHKDAGVFDSEAQNVPQPAGFAYIAPPSEGRNQYGYWDNSGGHSVWTWLPEYLIMRELLWGHDYRPIIVNDYYGYRTARTYGRTYYGQETPAAPPKYGSHGTFTQNHYASSRYIQSGGFRGSNYASHPGAPAVSSRPSWTPSAPSSEPSSIGKRFGGGESSAGHRFGSGSSPSSGRRFGSPSRSAGRSFGRRR